MCIEIGVYLLLNVIIIRALCLLGRFATELNDTLTA